MYVVDKASIGGSLFRIEHLLALLRVADQAYIQYVKKTMSGTLCNQTPEKCNVMKKQFVS